MRRLRSLRGGYTIVETLIYLAVTGVLFAGAATMISGQQNKTEFSQTVREIESFILDISNDISTGYYPSSGVGCTYGPTLGGSRALGSNGDCLFLGRVFHVAPAGANSAQTINVYTAVGNRLQGAAPNSPDSTTLTNANAIISPSILESRLFSKVISFKTLKYGGGNTGAFGFVSSLGSFSAAGNLDSGSSTANSVTVTGTSIGQAGGVIESAFATSRNENPGQIELCIESNSTKSHAIMTIGATNSSAGINSVIVSGDCP